MAAPHRKLWWPRPLYEVRPAVCLAAGALLGLGSVADAILEGYWPTRGAALLALGCVIAIYGGVTAQLRGEHRRTRGPTAPARGAPPRAPD